jgi:hypothetical protein
MAIKELFYDQRPVALLNAKASQRIDPRFTFTRNGEATYVDTDGKIKIAAPGQPRFDSDPLTGEKIGLLIEESRINIFSDTPFIRYVSGGGKWNGGSTTLLTPNAGEAPDGTNTASLYEQILPSSNTQSRIFHINSYTPLTNTQYVYSFFAKLSTSASENIVGFRIGTNIYTTTPGTTPGFLNCLFTFDSNGDVQSVTGPSTAGYQKYANGWYKLWLPIYTLNDVSAQIAPLTITVGGELGLAASTYGKFLIWGAQVEQTDGSITPSSLIYTPSSSEVTRPADLLSLTATIPASGSLYVDARATGVGTNTTLASITNSLNEKINLSIEELPELYGSPALVYSVQGTAKTTLPFPVPTTNRERNIITWGANNYQYGTSSARFAQSLSSLVPANLNKLSIGHDAVDPTKGFNGYINAAYLYRGEITPTVAEALVRGELDPVNADSFVPTGPAGSLSLVVNTQGVGATGDRVFELPAASVSSDNDIVITWGDQTESGLENSAAELGAPGLTKTYSAAGIYSIFVEGRLENLRFIGLASAPDLVQIVAWGTSANGNDVFRSPSTLFGAFDGCTQLDFSSTAKVSNLPDTSGVTDWRSSFRNCSSITGIFPSFNFSSATLLDNAFEGCTSLTSFTAAGNQTQNVTSAASAWRGCLNLSTFPNINLQNATTLRFAWQDCQSLTEFPALNIVSAERLDFAWRGCTSLASFPTLVTSNVENLEQAWFQCTSLNNIGVVPGATTSFPVLDTSNVTSFKNAWYECSSFVQFPLLTTSAGTNFEGAWNRCTSLANFPSIDTGNATNFRTTWTLCSSLSVFPTLTTNLVTNFSNAWNSCSGLSAFPAINTSSGTNFDRAWVACSSLTAFPQLDFSAATGSATDASNVESGFRSTWDSCTSLATFPANRFDSTNCNRYLNAWNNCALTAQSIENILVSINTAATTFNLDDGNLGIGGGTNAAQSTWSTAAVNAYNALIGRNWTITFNP